MKKEMGCVWHKPIQRSYNDAHEHAEKMIQAGKQQVQCLECKLWFWKDEFGKAHT